ncbi:glycosyltransferase, partial [Bacteroidota bacterium]|nr:glycosyltransferase [Bacteroidota bacterium]
FLKKFNLTYIGSGLLKKRITNTARKLGLNSIKFLKKIDRSQIVEELDRADCLIMVSKGEAFGLVYLEAMSRGCIVIGSKNEGIDGIIVDGVNGFLSEAGNKKELIKKLKLISNLSNEEIIEIKLKAIETAKNYSEEKAARGYLNDILLNLNDIK